MTKNATDPSRRMEGIVDETDETLVVIPTARKLHVLDVDGDLLCRKGMIDPEEYPAIELWQARNDPEYSGREWCDPCRSTLGGESAQYQMNEIALRLGLDSFLDDDRTHFTSEEIETIRDAIIDHVPPLPRGCYGERDSDL